MHRIGKNDMKYAYLIMGRYDEKTDRAEIQDGKARIVGVKDLETACTVANELIKEGVNCIELCGGFGSAYYSPRYVRTIALRSSSRSILRIRLRALLCVVM